MTADEFRRLALSMPGAIESAHMGHPDFRAGGRIFATLSYPDQAWGMVKLTPEQQEAFVSAAPDVFAPVKGGWGLGGATNVNLEVAKLARLRVALAVAWRNVAPASMTRAAPAKMAASKGPAAKRVKLESKGTKPKPKSKRKLNAKWHAAHPLGKNPTETQRVRWHVAHAKACVCRAMPAGVLALLRAHGIEPPTPRGGTPRRSG